MIYSRLCSWCVIAGNVCSFAWIVYFLHYLKFVLNPPWLFCIGVDAFVALVEKTSQQHGVCCSSHVSVVVWLFGYFALCLKPSCQTCQQVC